MCLLSSFIVHLFGNQSIIYSFIQLQYTLCKKHWKALGGAVSCTAHVWPVEAMLSFRVSRACFQPVTLAHFFPHTDAVDYIWVTLKETFT